MQIQMYIGTEEDSGGRQNDSSGSGVHFLTLFLNTFFIKIYFQKPNKRKTNQGNATQKGPWLALSFYLVPGQDYTAEVGVSVCMYVARTVSYVSLSVCPFVRLQDPSAISLSLSLLLFFSLAHIHHWNT